MPETSREILFCAFKVVPDNSGISARASEFLRVMQGKATFDALTLKTPDHPHIERYLGVRLMRVPVGNGDIASRLQAFERAVIRQLESDEYQLVHFTDPFSGNILADLKSKHHFKLVYDACGFPSVELPYTDPHLEGDRKFMADLKRWRASA